MGAGAQVAAMYVVPGSPDLATAAGVLAAARTMAALEVAREPCVPHGVLECFPPPYDGMHFPRRLLECISPVLR